MTRILWQRFFFVLTLLISATVFAQDNAKIEAIQTQMQDDGKKMTQALNMTADQATQFDALSKKATAQRVTILEQYGVGTGKKLGMRDKLAMRDAMNKVTSEANVDVAKILTADQMKTYTQMQKQFSAALKKQILSS